jgi:hypothetical protein
MAPAPHDTLIKHALADPTEVGAWLGVALSDRPWCRRVCWDRLTTLPTEHPGRDDAIRSDLVFRSVLRDADVLIVLPVEHQTRVDRRISARQFAYTAHLLARPELRRGAVVVVPIVLYQGRGPWTAPRTLLGSLGVPEDVFTSFAGDVAHSPYVLLDLHRMPELLRAPATITLALALLREGRLGSAWQALGTWAWLLPEAVDRRGRAYLQQLLDYTYEVEQAPPPDEVVDMIARTREDVADTFVSYADRLREEGWQRGRREGVREGRQEGHQEGQREALLHNLTLLLQARTGPLSEDQLARLAVAGPDQLRAWFVRACAGETADVLLG